MLELLLTLLEKPSDSSIEVAVSLAKETGAFLQDVAPGPANQCALTYLFRNPALHASAASREIVCRCCKFSCVGALLLAACAPAR